MTYDAPETWLCSRCQMSMSADVVRGSHRSDCGGSVLVRVFSDSDADYDAHLNAPAPAEIIESRSLRRVRRDEWRKRQAELMQRLTSAQRWLIPSAFALALLLLPGCVGTADRAAMDKLRGVGQSDAAQRALYGEPMPAPNLAERKTRAHYSTSPEAREAERTPTSGTSHGQEPAKTTLASGVTVGSHIRPHTADGRGRKPEDMGSTSPATSDATVPLADDEELCEDPRYVGTRAGPVWIKRKVNQ
jgi:hypothetical protein